MAKDRTRHARRREPERVDTSLYDMVAQGMGRALVGLADGVARGLADFTDAVFSTVLDCAEMCGRLTDDSD